MAAGLEDAFGNVRCATVKVSGFRNAAAAASMALSFVFLMSNVVLLCARPAGAVEGAVGALEATAGAQTVTSACGHDQCVLGNVTTCPVHYCCVKKALTFLDKPACVWTECRPLLTEGVMCLKYPEDYMCPCLPGMTCHIPGRFDTFGHCRPHAR